MYALILRWLDERGTTRGSVPLDGADVELGRELIAQLGGTPDASVSRRHARIFTKGAGFAIEDLGSRNGTLVNGTRIDGATAVRSGDLIEVGEQRFRFGPAAVI